MKSGRGKTRLEWWEPRWSYRARLKLEFARFIDAKMWFRILALVGVVALLFAVVIKRCVPDLEFDWGRGVALSFLCFLLYAGFFVVMFWWIPPIIRISDKGISRQQGQSIHWRLREDIRRIEVDTTVHERPVLRVESSQKAFEAGVSDKVAPEELTAFLRQTFPGLSVEERR